MLKTFLESVVSSWTGASDVVDSFNASDRTFGPITLSLAATSLTLNGQGAGVCHKPFGEWRQASGHMDSVLPSGLSSEGPSTLRVKETCSIPSKSFSLSGGIFRPALGIFWKAKNTFSVLLLVFLFFILSSWSSVAASTFMTMTQDVNLRPNFTVAGYLIYWDPCVSQRSSPKPASASIGDLDYVSSFVEPLQRDSAPGGDVGMLNFMAYIKRARFATFHYNLPGVVWTRMSSCDRDVSLAAVDLPLGEADVSPAAIGNLSRPLGKLVPVEGKPLV